MIMDAVIVFFRENFPTQLYSFILGFIFGVVFCSHFCPGYWDYRKFKLIAKRQEREELEKQKKYQEELGKLISKKKAMEGLVVSEMNGYYISKDNSEPTEDRFCRCCIENEGKRVKMEQCKDDFNKIYCPVCGAKSRFMK